MEDAGRSSTPPPIPTSEGVVAGTVDVETKAGEDVGRTVSQEELVAQDNVAGNPQTSLVDTAEDKVSKDADGGEAYELAPLPTEFDPDAPTPELKAAPLPEEDELALAPREDEPEAVGGDRMEVEVDGAGPGEEGNDMQDPSFLAMLSELQTYKADGEADDDAAPDEKEEGQPPTSGGSNEDAAMAEPQEPEEARKSPSPIASPIPALPTEFPTEDTLPPLPTTLFSTAVPNNSSDCAESSTAEAHRAMGPSGGTSPLSPPGSPSPPPDGRSSVKRKGKAPERLGGGDAYHDWMGDDDLVGLDEKPKKKYRKFTTLEGKPLRVSNKGQKRIDASLGIDRHGAKPLDKLAPRGRNLDDKKLKAMVKGKSKAAQATPCLRALYAPWGKCTQCISKIGGDACRFRGYRFFPLNPETSEITGPGIFESTPLDQPMTELPRDFNAPLTEERIVSTENTVAPLLLPLISQEMRLVVNHDALFRGTDAAKSRSVCDFCASTIFAGFFFCRKCGRDFCLQCERYFGEATELRDSPWPLPDNARPRLHKCTRDEDSVLPFTGKQPKGKFSHYRNHLHPISRFTAEEMRSNWLNLADFVLEPSGIVNVDDRIEALGIAPEETELLANVREWFASNKDAEISAPKSALTEADIADLYEASKSLPRVEDPAGIKQHPFMHIHVNRLTDDVFNDMWSRGEPMVVSGVGERFKFEWSPDMLIQRFGGQPCYAFDCENEQIHEMTVEFFFTMFKGEIPLTRTERVLLERSRAPNAGAVEGADGRLSPATPASNQPLPVAMNGSSQQHTHEHATQKTEADHIPSVAVSSPHGVTKAIAADRTPTAAESSVHTPPFKEPTRQHSLSPGTARAATDVPREKDDDVAMSGDGIAPTNTSAQPAETSEKEHANRDKEAPNGVAGTEECVTRVKEGQPEKETGGEATGGSDRQGPDGEKVGEKVGNGSDSQVVQDGEAAVRKRPKIMDQILKLKDWPSTEDFEYAYPELYNDFSDALPVPNYTRRNGVMNLYSHFPEGPTRPDIGPKMYNAFASKEDGNGTTRLHMDMADAVNVMLYAAPGDDGSRGCAVWDLFAAKDADAIREFLKSKYDPKTFSDPIHSQMFYLNTELRKELFETRGIASHRVYQYPGDAVFIPAGCAHQVCNLANCIKIAIDFVSPHNVRRCQRLTQDFRAENYMKVWKDDVLQLYNVMWYAWTNVRETRERHAKEAAEAQVQERARHARLAELQSGGGSRPYYHPSERSGYLATATSSVRDDPTPSSPRTNSRDGTPTASGTRTPDRASKEHTPAPEDESSKRDPSVVEDKSPRRQLAQRLLEAALKREPIPVSIEPMDVKQRPPPPPPIPVEPPASEPAPAAQPVRLSESIKKGHIPLDLPLAVLRGAMGKREPGDLDGDGDEFML